MRPWSIGRNRPRASQQHGTTHSSTAKLVRAFTWDAPAVQVAAMLRRPIPQVAMESAQVSLMDSDLRKLVVSVELGRYTLRKIRQNIAFALVSKLLMVAITVAGRRREGWIPRARASPSPQKYKNHVPG